MGKKITKVSFREAGSKGVFVAYSTYSEDGLVMTAQKDFKPAPHSTFVDAMAKFIWHMLFLTEIKNVDDFNAMPAPSAISGYRVTGVSISGSDEKEKVVITGYKTLSNGKGFSFNTPPHLLASEEYQHGEDLVACIETLSKEAIEYMNGKHGVVQGDLFKEGDEKEGEEEESPTTVALHETYTT